MKNFKKIIGYLILISPVPVLFYAAWYNNKLDQLIISLGLSVIVMALIRLSLKLIE